MDLEKFYKQINLNTIEEFIKNKQEEHLNLEFKTVSKADLSDKNDRKNLAKSMAGFANSDGGIIIWGVDARKQYGIDCANGKKEIQPLPQLVSRLNDLTGELVKPIVEGVKHKGIPHKATKGFAVTLVPESDSGPHMAMGFKGRHYKRSGDSFYPMEHFDIEDMFGRRKKPKLSLRTQITKTGGESGSRRTFYDCGVIILIENFGRGIAKYISLALSVNPPYIIGKYGLDHEGRFGLLRLPEVSPSKARFLGDANIVIHSKSFLDITIIKRRINANCSWIEDLTIEYEIKAEEMMSIEDKMTIKGAEILSKVIPHERKGS